MTSRSPVFKPWIYFELAVQRNTLKVIFSDATDCIAFYIFVCVCTCVHTYMQWMPQQALGSSVAAQVDPTSAKLNGRRKGWSSVFCGCRRQDLQVVSLQQGPWLHRYHTVLLENLRTQTFSETFKGCINVDNLCLVGTTRGHSRNSTIHSHPSDVKSTLLSWCYFSKPAGLSL